jgi:hypothetical protein
MLADRRMRWCMMSADEADRQTGGRVHGGRLRASNRRTPTGRPAGVSRSQPSTVPPVNAADLEVWLRTLIRDTDPRNLPAVLAEAEAAASEWFPADQVVAALRRALAAPP